MVRSAFADEHSLNYITSIARVDSFSIGLILGQSCLGKDYVIHFARTPPYQSIELKNIGLPGKQVKNILEINDKWVADHARHATRMLPGGMFVLGIFIVSPDDLITQFNSKVKAILITIHKLLEGSSYLYGNGGTEKLVLNFSSKTEKYLAKSYDVITSSIHSVDFKFLTKAIRWHNVECTYMIDQLHYLKSDEADWPLQKHIKGVLDDINGSFENCIFIFDGEAKDKDENLENIGKKRVQRSSSSKNYPDTQDGIKPINISIFQSFRPQSSKDISANQQVFKSAGQLKIIGQVVSKLWLQPKMSVSEASNAIKQDIMRSLSTRFEMHWDSLTEEENSEDINCVHEPPRRVLVALPNSKITLSDYLFPGEGAQDAKDSLEELLDIKLDGKIEIQDAEGQADISEYYNKSGLDSESEEVLPSLPTDTNKFMYSVGLGIALLVLILSLVIHFYK